jgi:hypothetical protein
VPLGRRLIAVSPPAALDARPRLFAALAAAHPVAFEPRPAGQWGGADAAVRFRDGEDGEPAGTATIPVLELLAAPRERERAAVELAEDEALDPVLRGRRLDDEELGGVAALDAGSGERVLAVAGRRALWSGRGGPVQLRRAALAPPELGPREGLRDLLRPGRWLSLLPLEQFLREVSRELAWTPPPLRAVFMCDDANLHWPSYGRLNFGELARHASLHGYHVAVALIPLDGWLVHPSAGWLFRRRRDVLSLVMHGNDHTRLELYRDMPRRERNAIVAQAIRRSDALEYRHGLHVDRVMSAPHGLAGEEAIAAMFSLGIEALAADWPFPWAPLDLPPPGWPLAGWEPAQLVAGLPVLRRYLLAKPLDDLVFQAFLRQPLIVYGHHRVGLDLLGAVARRINALGDVAWSSAETIARSNYATRREGSTLRVRAFSRRLHVGLPDGVQELVVELPASYGAAEPLVLEVVRRDGGPASTLGLGPGRRATEPLTVPPGDVEILIRPRAATDPYAVPAPRRRAWPLVRRALTEARDRVLPFLSEEI